MVQRTSPKLTVSMALLVAANMIPVVGVFLWDWNVFFLLLLFWCENVVIGLSGIGKIVASGGGLVIALFFTIHYGGFMAGHLFFLNSLFGDPGVDPLVALRSVFEQLGWLPILALLISHGWSFFSNFLATDERLSLTPSQAMSAPYKRMVVTHVAIIASGFFLIKLGEPMVGLLMLVGMKLALDVFFHRREHHVV